MPTNTGPMSNPWKRAALLVSVLAVPSAAIPREAIAEQEIAIEPRGSFAMVKDDPQGGVGTAVDVGLSLDLEPIVVQPELRLVGEGLPGLPGGSLAVMAGVRAGIAWKFEPSIFVHVGWGFVGNDEFTSSGYAIDAGFTADYRVKRWLTVGGSVGYQVFVDPSREGDDTIHGVFAGPRIGFWID